MGYGVQNQLHGGGPAVWSGLRVRLYTPSELASGEFVHSNLFLRLALNPGGGSGGMCYGDSGGPDLLRGTNVVLAVNSYGTNSNCSGVGYASRIDIPEVLNWINGSHPEAPRTQYPAAWVESRPKTHRKRGAHRLPVPACECSTSQRPSAPNVLRPGGIPWPLTSNARRP